MEYMCFNREGAIFTLNGGPLKLTVKFMLLGSSISSTESDVIIRKAVNCYQLAINHIEV